MPKIWRVWPEPVSLKCQLERTLLSAANYFTLKKISQLVNFEDHALEPENGITTYKLGYKNIIRIVNSKSQMKGWAIPPHVRRIREDCSHNLLRSLLWPAQLPATVPAAGRRSTAAWLPAGFRRQCRSGSGEARRRAGRRAAAW